MILLIDNYDSFTFNLYQLIEQLGRHCKVVRNDQISIAEIEDLAPSQIVISPGPGRPDEAGITLDVIRAFQGRLPILGVCLGHQAIGQVFGAKVVKATSPKHGKRSEIQHQERGVFAGLRSPLLATRYHSLIVEKASLPECLEITSEAEGGVIMGLRHRHFDIEGVQFHPESIATEFGAELMENFLRRSH
jgi:anthranilate synthase/aminodeoxychorismate synthase-like glutamine amidotransferase